MNQTRRDFISAGAAAAAMGLAGCRTEAPASAWKPDPNAEIWAAYLPFGRNMWSDVPVPEWGGNKGDTPEKRKALLSVVAADHIRFDETTWQHITAKMASVGMNMVVIDLGEALEYPSHPELAVKGSWKPDRFRKELARLRGMGLEPIPKLNFSTGHDTWLGVYHRMVSTPTYYKVCADLIADVCDIFDTPRLFHLGYDEETAANQKYYGYVCVRQGELWWHDFLWFERTVAEMGPRPWIWSDYIWWHREEFVKRMPKRVLQSNWYYNSDKIDPKLHKGPQTAEAKEKHWDQRVWTAAYQWLEDAGFDQAPCGSNCGNDRNFGAIVEWGRTHVPPERLKGFCMAPWILTMPQKRDKGLAAIDIVRKAREDFEAKSRKA